MKKYLAILLALVLCLSLGVTAFAEGEAPSVKPADVTVTKTYKLSGGESAPVETLTFTVEPDAGNLGGVTGDVVVGSNNSLTTNGTASTEFKVSFPTYTKVGVYKYTITEVAPNPATAGVTYDTEPIVIVVTVTNTIGGDDGATSDQLAATVAIHKGDESGDKEMEDGAFVNEFGMGKLTVTKTVSGNLASNSKKFLIHVTFNSEAPVGSPIVYTVAGGTEQSVEVDGETVVDIELSHGESAVFTDIPAGVSYTVKEDEQHTSLAEGEAKETSEEGYTATYANEEGEIAAEDDITCTVTNTKETEVDTGVILDSLPYVLVVAVVLSAAVLMFVNKRRSEV